jgi:putative copper export protein
VVAAGLVASWLYVCDISDLWLTDYGLVLALKAVLVCGVMVCGYINWQRLRKLHAESDSSFTLIEVALAVAVAIVTGYLTEIAHP